MLKVAATRLPSRSKMEKWVVSVPAGAIRAASGRLSLGVAWSRRMVAASPAP